MSIYNEEDNTIEFTDDDIYEDYIYSDFPSIISNTIYKVIDINTKLYINYSYNLKLKQLLTLNAKLCEYYNISMFSQDYENKFNEISYIYKMKNSQQPVVQKKCSNLSTSFTIK